MNKFIFLLLITIASFSSFSQVVLVENFDYPLNEALASHGWTAHSSSGTNSILTTSGLIFSHYLGSGIGNAANLINSGEDISKNFSKQTGTIYISFLFKTGLANAAGYFLHFSKSESGGSPHIAKIFVNADGTQIGISNATNPSNFTTIEVNKTYLAVIKIDLINKKASLLISDTFIDKEPKSSCFISDTIKQNISEIRSISLRQYNKKQNIVIDAIRVAKSWQEAVKSSIEKTESPIASHNSGAYFSPFQLSFNCNTLNANIFYRIKSENGDWQQYTNAINIKSPSDIEVFSSKEGMHNSDTVLVSYIFPTIVENISKLYQNQINETLYYIKNESIITYKTTEFNIKFIQDNSGAIMIIDTNNVINKPYNLYDGIKGITGKIVIINNLRCFMPILRTDTLSSTNNIITPTLAQFNNLNPSIQCKLVKLNNIKIVNNNSTNLFEAYKNYKCNNFYLKHIEIYTAFSSLDYISKLIPKQTLSNVTGIMLFKDNTFFFIPRSKEDFSNFYTPSISLTANNLLNFNYNYNSNESSEISFFHIAALNLTNNIKITSPTNFEISLATGEAFSPQTEITLAPDQYGKVNKTQIFVRLKSNLPIGIYKETIVINNQEIGQKIVNLRGKVKPIISEEPFETFDNLTISGSGYYDGFFIGQNNTTWSYYQCRGDYALNGKAIMIGRNRTPQSSVTSGVIKKGISTLQFNYFQPLSTKVNLNVEVNGKIVANVRSNNLKDSILLSPIIEVNNPFDCVIKFINASNSDGQVVIDNIKWSSFNGELKPKILNITHLPEQNITPDTTVIVKANIISYIKIKKVQLLWGLDSLNLANIIEMDLTNENEYITSQPITKQPNGTTIYYMVSATDTLNTSSFSNIYNYTSKKLKPNASFSILKRPQFVDLTSSNSESAILVCLSNYSSNDVRYKLFNSAKLHYCWDNELNIFSTASNFLKAPKVHCCPSDTSVFWIAYKRGSNNNTKAIYRDKIGPNFKDNHLTDSLPNALKIEEIFFIKGRFIVNENFDINSKYIVLSYFDSQLISASTTDLHSGNFSISCPVGYTINKIEIRDFNNNLIYDINGNWNSSCDIGFLPNDIYTASLEVSHTTLNNFIHTAGFAHPNIKYFEVNGKNLEGYIKIIAPNNYQISLKDSNLFTPKKVIFLNHISGTLHNTKVYVRLNPNLEAGDYNNFEINIHTKKAISKRINCSGKVKPNKHNNTLAGQIKLLNVNETLVPHNYNNNLFYIQLFTNNQAIASKQIIHFNSSLNLSSYFNFKYLNPKLNYSVRLWEIPSSNLITDTWTWKNHNGVNAADALLINKLVTNDTINSFPWIYNNSNLNISQLAKLVSDINNDNKLNAIDAVLALQLSVEKTLLDVGISQPNFIISGNFADNHYEKLYPNSPNYFFKNQGDYNVNSQANTIFYEVKIGKLTKLNSIFNIYFVSKGNLNLSE